jgi:hypothetical protein
MAIATKPYSGICAEDFDPTTVAYPYLYIARRISRPLGNNMALYNRPHIVQRHSGYLLTSPAIRANQVSQALSATREMLSENSPSFRISFALSRRNL